MEVKEGVTSTITHHYLPEILVQPKRVNGDFLQYNKQLLEADRERNYDDCPSPKKDFPIEGFDSFDGYWRFWDKLYDEETLFSYKNIRPLFYAPSLDLQLEADFQDEFSFEDYKISTNVVYYPFGLFSIRVKTYFKLEEGISVEKFLRMRDQLIDNVAWDANGSDATENLFDQLKARISNTVLSESTDEPYRKSKRAFRDRYHVTYLYNETETEKEELAKLVAGIPHNLAESYRVQMTKPQLGKIEGDQIIAKETGAFLYTPYFHSDDTRSRRWKRLMLLNNVYLSTDIAQYERKCVSILNKEFQRIRDVLIRRPLRETLVGTPMKAWQLAALDDSLRLVNHLHGTRREICYELKPPGRDDSKAKLGEMGQWLIAYDSELENAVKKAYGMLFERIIPIP